MIDISDQVTINFLPKPDILPNKLKYITNSKKVYANLYEISLTKVLKIYQYPYKVSPDIEVGDIRMRQNLYKSSRKE